MIYKKEFYMKKHKNLFIAAAVIALAAEKPNEKSHAEIYENGKNILSFEKTMEEM